jgi:hypothetical protein
MPSFTHEILVDLCRQRGELARALARLCGVVVDGARIEIGSIDLSQVVPTEYRADAVTVFRDDEIARGAIIIEVQLQPDPDKWRSWPVYVSGLRAVLHCPVYLLIIAPDPAVARWARTPIELGHPGFQLMPLVISFDELPRVTDPYQAEQIPELAVLSVLAHPELEVAGAAVHAIQGLPEDRARLYWDLMLTALPGAVRRSLEKMMIKGYVYQSEFARKYYGEGFEKGQAEGLEKGLQEAALELVRAKLPDLSADDEAAVRALHDEATLRALIGALVRAMTPDETRAILRAARPAG